MSNREALLTETFVSLADTLVNDFDVVDFLSFLSARCLELFGADEAGLMLADQHGKMRLVASSSHQMEALELLEIQHDEGPCPDAYRSSARVASADLELELDRWPTFAPAALGAGFHSVLAVPMRLRGEVIGALNLIRRPPGTLTDEDEAAAQALADVATIGLLQHRAAREARLLAEQLQYALNSRVVIEQAKGVLAEHLQLDMSETFDALRRYARNNNRRLADVAESIVDRTLDPDLIAAAPTRRR